MTTTLDNLMQHFRNSNQKSIIDAGEAVANGNFDAFQSVVDRVVTLPVITSISNLINTSSAARKGFLDKVKMDFDPEAMRVFFGVGVLGIGGGALAEAITLAAALGISVLTVKVIAGALLLWGLLIILPVIYGRALEMLRQETQKLGIG